METYPVVVAENSAGETIVCRRLDPTAAPEKVDLETEAIRHRAAASKLGQFPPTNFRLETRTTGELGLID